MTITKFIRKPSQLDAREYQHAARFTPGEPLDDLVAVARMADSHAVLRVADRAGTPCLIVIWQRVPDCHEPELEAELVRPGHWLAYSPPGGHLYEADDANWAQFYDREPQP